MKRKLLLLITILAFSPFLWSQETVECYPASADYNTGSTNGTEFTQTSLIKTAAGLVEAGWARFDLSSVPANAPIQSVELHIYVAVDNNAYWQVMSMEEDPLLGTAESVFADCTSGNIYGGWQGADFPEPDWFIADLGEEAVSALNSQLADGWFGISMWEYEGGGIYAIECEGWDETNPPYIVVSYLPVGTVFPPYDPDPANGAFEVGLESDLNWTFGANTENYDLYFGTDNPPTTKVIDNAVSGANGTYDPGTLEYITTYYWQVISRNSTTEVAGPIWSFDSECGSATVPIIEDFETVIPPELPYCWFGLVNSTSPNPYVQTLGYNGIDNSYCVSLYNSDDPSPSLLFISPQLEGGVAGKYVNFFAWGYDGPLSVGTIADPSDETTFNEIATVTLSNMYQDYQEFETFFTNYTGTDNYIAFKANPTYTYGGTYIDDILIDFAPTCPKPTDLYTSETTTNSATIGWTENGDAMQWNIEYGPFGFTPTGVGNALATTNPFELTGLESGTTYEFYVQADCGGGDVSYWVGPSWFQTGCEPTAVPYFEGFEQAPIPAIPPCMLVENTNGDANLWYTDNTEPFAGENTIRINYNYAMAMDDWFYSAPLDLEGGVEYMVEFYYTSNSSFYIEQLEVKWGTDAVSTAMTNGPIFEDLGINYEYVYHEGVGFFTPDTDGVYYVGWHGFSIPNQYNIFVDNITIDVTPTCLKPTEVSVSAPTNSSTTVSWLENGTATQWNIEYVYAGEAPTGVPSFTVDTNPFEITGLEPGTSYDCYVQADCGAGDLSWWSAAVTFTTLCDAIDVPIFEDFTDVTIPDLPDCWMRYINSISNYAAVNTYEWTYYSPPYSLWMDNSNDIDAEVILISPSISETDGAAGKYINFFALGYAPELSIGTMSDPYDGSTYTEYTTVSLTNEFQEYDVFFTNYTGTDNFIAFKGVYNNTYQSIYIDDLTIDHPPTCPKPNELFVNTATTTTAMLNWTENGDATLWNIEYGYSGFTPTGVPTISAVTSNPFELIDLEAGTTYDCYVQADCGAGDLSLWSQPTTFTTQCEAFEVTLVENFDGVTAPNLPNCWSPIVEASTSYAFVETINWMSNSAPNCVELYNSDDQFADLFFVSPPLVDPINTLWLNFFAATDPWGLASGIVVGAITDPLDASTFTGIDTIYYTVGGIFEEYEVFFSDYTGTDQFIAIKGLYSGTYQYVYIDDITIDHPPTCPKPNDLFVGITTPTTAMLNWTENGEATMWNIEYVYAGESPTGVPSLSVDTNPYELTDLEDGTAYEFYVQADCGGGDLSYWNGPEYFQTQCYPAELPYFEDFEEAVFPPTLPVCMTYDDSNDDGVTWQSSNNLPYSGLFHMMVGYTFSEPEMDDWFFSAPMELLGGQTYNLVFYYTTNTSNYQENLEVKFGTEPTGEGMTSEPIFVDEMFAYNNEYQLAEVQFSPDEDGLYFLGWHCYSISGQWDTYIDDIYVEWDNSLIVTATATPDEICEGDESVLNGSGIGGTGNYTYSWTSDPAGFTSTEADPTVMPDVTTDYILELNDGMISMYDTVTVVVHDYPGAPGAPVGIGYMCANIANTTYSSSGASGAGSYLWVLDPPEAGTVSGTSTSISVSWDVNFTGTISLTVAGVNNGCEGPASNPLSIIRYLPEVTLEPFDLVEHDWPAFELTGGTPEGGEYSGSGCVDGWFHPDVAGLGDHTITYTYSDASLCENSADQILTVVLDIGINEQHNLKVNISPNPSNGIFNLNVNSSSRKAVNIMVVNNYGKEVFEITNAKLNETYSTEIDLSNYAKGLYYIKIYSDDIYYVEKVIIK